MSKKIYQLVSFANGYNKRTKEWESLRSVTKTYIGRNGLKSAYFLFGQEVNEIKYYEQLEGGNKYSYIRAKVEIQIPHISDKRSQTHWVCFMKCGVSDNGI